MEANFNYRTVEGSVLPRLISEPDPGNPGNSGGASDGGVQTVTLASPLNNGQFYVIGSPSDLLGTAAGLTMNQRSIAPRTTLTLEAGNPSTAKQIELKDLNRTATSLTDKLEKIGNRKATHNEVERRRRDNINHWIMKLGKLLPQDSTDDDPLTSMTNGNKPALSKGGILAKVCEYVTELKDTNDFLRESLTGKDELIAENARLKADLQKLQVENMKLRQQQQLSQNSPLDPKAGVYSYFMFSIPPRGSECYDLYFINTYIEYLILIL